MEKRSAKMLEISLKGFLQSYNSMKGIEASNDKMRYAKAFNITLRKQFDSDETFTILNNNIANQKPFLNLDSILFSIPEL